MSKGVWHISTILLILLLTLPFVAAQTTQVQTALTGNISITVTPIKDKVSEGDWAIFDVTILNLYKESDFITLSVREEGVEWSVITESTFDYTTGFEVLPKKSRTTRLLLKEKGLNPSSSKPYSVSLDVMSENAGKKPVSLKIFVVPEPTIVYVSDINVTPYIPRYIDPRNIYSFTILLKNNNPKDIKNLNITLESTLVNRQASVSLEPENDKAIEFSVDLEDEQSPLLDTLTIIVNEENTTQYRETVPFEIVSYRIPFSKKIELTKGFLSSIETITVTNNENVESQKTVTHNTRKFDSWFAKADPKETYVTEQTEDKIIDIMTWEIRLKPGESATIVVKRNYILPALILIAIIAIIAGYYVLRDPVTVTKQAEVLKTMDGGIHELKVIIIIKNRKHISYKNTRIVDMILGPIELEKSIKVGTLHPTKVLKRERGTVLDWKFDLDENEERIITYKVTSKLSILGELKLPRAIAVIQKDGKERKIKSNELFVSS